MIFPESELAHKYCIGQGIEIGAAAHNPFRLKDCKILAGSDRLDWWRQSELDMCGEYIKPDYIGDAEHIPVEDNIFNYVITSHVIEHVPNPIAAFIEWNRVLKNNGIVFMIFPKRDSDPNDINRPINNVCDFVKQYNENLPLNDHKHHIWVFDLQLMINLIQYCTNYYNLNWTVIEALETDEKVGNGHCVVVRVKK